VTNYYLLRNGYRECVILSLLSVWFLNHTRTISICKIMAFICESKIIYVNNFNILNIILAVLFLIKFIWYVLCLANIRHLVRTIF
jgi:hypothetical protein